MPADGQADLAVDLEAACGGEEAEGGGTQGVAGGEGDAPVVDPVGERGGRGGAAKREVPFEEVGVAEGARVDVGGGVRGEFGGFAEDAAHGGGVYARHFGRGSGWGLGLAL